MDAPLRWQKIIWKMPNLLESELLVDIWISLMKSFGCARLEHQALVDWLNRKATSSYHRVLAKHKTLDGSQAGLATAWMGIFSALLCSAMSRW